MDKRSIAPALFGVVVGFFICCFLVYPPHAKWNEGLDLGDVATWFSTFATTAAVIVALVISGRDQRRRDAERAADADAADFRAALLLHPAFGNLSGVVLHVARQLQKFEAMNSDIFFEMPDGESLSDLQLQEFDDIAKMHPIAAGVSKELAGPVLLTIAWSRQVASTLKLALIPIGKPERNMHVIARGNVKNLKFPVGVLQHHLQIACSRIEALLGDALLVPNEVIDGTALRTDPKK